MFDLLCSEYGWTLEYVLERVTPAQVEVLAAAIARRRREELARTLGALRIAVWGDEAQWQMVRRTLTDEERDEAPALALMGIAVKRSRGGPRRDDSQPAG